MKQVVEQCIVSFEKSGEGATEAFHAKFRFPPELEVFDGHFPGAPLVPGVFLLEAVRISAERAVGHSLRISRVKDAKFVQMVKPDDIVEIEGTFHGERCSARLSGGTRLELDLTPNDC